MATYAIGDVQGCFDELQSLLKQIKFNSDCDQLWFCGDIVNRGPKSLATLRFIRSLQDNAITVLGNHDLHLLATAFLKNNPGKHDTFTDILQAKDSLEDLNWLQQQPLIHHENNITLIHAGIHPKWSIAKTIELANEVKSLLQSNKNIEFYKHMYGDKPNNWHYGLSGSARYRFITNTLTRLRYCSVTGKQALNAKGPPGSQPEDLLPWYEIPDRKTKDDVIIFGHWSTLPHAGVSDINNCYAIDSGCLWGGALTALRIDQQPFEYIRLNCQGVQKPSKKYL